MTVILQLGWFCLGFIGFVLTKIEMLTNWLILGVDIIVGRKSDEFALNTQKYVAGISELQIESQQLRCRQPNRFSIRHSVW